MTTINNVAWQCPACKWCNGVTMLMAYVFDDDLNTNRIECPRCHRYYWQVAPGSARWLDRSIYGFDLQLPKEDTDE